MVRKSEARASAFMRGDMDKWAGLTIADDSTRCSMWRGSQPGFEMKSRAGWRGSQAISETVTPKSNSSNPMRQAIWSAVIERQHGEVGGLRRTGTGAVRVDAGHSRQGAEAGAGSTAMRSARPSRRARDRGHIGPRRKSRCAIARDRLKKLTVYPAKQRSPNALLQTVRNGETRNERPLPDRPMCGTSGLFPTGVPDIRRAFRSRYECPCNIRGRRTDTCRCRNIHRSPACDRRIRR